MPATLGYEDLLAVGKPVMPPEPEEADAAILMYTGGTTGFPKGALLEQRAEVLNVYHVLSEIGLREERRFLFQSPMFHAALVAGVLGIPATGATSVTIPLFDPGLVLRTIEEQRSTRPWSSRSCCRCSNGPKAFPRSAYGRCANSSTEHRPSRRTSSRRWLKMLPDTDFIQGYGMTEAASVLTFLGPEDHRRGGDALTASGKPLFGVELRITDSLGNALPRGEVGEVCARGGNLMRDTGGSRRRPKR